MYVSLKTILVLITAPIVFIIVKRVYRGIVSPLRTLPGPGNASLLLGHVKGGFTDERFSEWVAEYGSALTFRGFLGMRGLLTVDLKAVNHILQNAYNYPKPDGMRYNLGRMVGPGILVVEGHQHKQQRKVMNPAFAPSHIKELSTTFLDKAIQLRDILASECATSPDGAFRTDVLPWLSKVSLDIIGLTGFNYPFNSLNPNNTPSELNTAFEQIVSSASGLFRMMQGLIPILRLVPTAEGRAMRSAQVTMSRIGYSILQESRAFSNEKQNIGRPRDLLSLLVRANMSTDIPESQRISDEDVIAQVPTFLVAGHETTAAAVSWALYSITERSDVQAKLRTEILSVATESPTFDELNALPYLDMVLKETLRLHAPVTNAIRVAVKDDLIPVSKHFRHADGVTRDYIGIRKGEVIVIPLRLINIDTAIWGDDAEVFKPERWEKLPSATSAIPGVWGNMMTFLSGPRSCIGYRFALAEAKAILFTLLRAFEFELAVPHDDVGKKAYIVDRPYVKSDEAAGYQLPMIVKAVT